MPNFPYPYEVSGKLVMGNSSLTPISSLSNHSLSPSLTVQSMFWNIQVSQTTAVYVVDRLYCHKTASLFNIYLKSLFFPFYWSFSVKVHAHDYTQHWSMGNSLKKNFEQSLGQKESIYVWRFNTWVFNFGNGGQNFGQELTYWKENI